MFSRRFALPVRVTRHAAARMRERRVSDGELLAVLEHGTIRRKDDRRLWVYHEQEGRDDNLVCAAVVLKDALVVKTVMIRWEVLDEN